MSDKVLGKGDLVNIVSEKTEVSKKVTQEVINAVIEAIEEAVAEGSEVRITGFGTFKAVERGERTVNAFGKKTKVPARKVPTFKVGKGFKEKVEG